MNEKKRTVLAFDLGVSCGRGILVHYENDALCLEEIHRFPNAPIFDKDHLYWDIISLLQEICTALRLAWNAGGFDSIGIDAWGTDYALIDKRGVLMENPLHYPDPRTNTAFQLLEHQTHAPELFKQAQTFLLIPDLFAYLLTGDLSTEPSIASTTQLFNLHSGSWSEESIHALGLPEHIFPAIAQTGTIKGMLSEKLCKKLGIASVPVIAVCGHNAQCAATAIPALDKKPFAFLDCDSRALLGTELDHPVITEQASALGISNALGLENKFTFFKRITGIWILQELQYSFQKQDNHYSFSDFEKMMTLSEPYQRFIDVAAPAFSIPGDIIIKIRKWCIESGQPDPQDVADIIRCIYESLACHFRGALDELESCMNQKCEKIYMLGDGVKDPLLCQLTADACQIPVCTGSEEASALGNAVIQLIASGVVPDLLEARWLIAKSCKSQIYMPNSRNASLYQHYQELFKQD